MFKALFSIVVWPIWFSAFIFFGMIYYILMTVFSSKRLHPIARIISRALLFFGGQWLIVNGKPPANDEGPYLYLINHASLFDTFMTVAAIPHYFTGVGKVEQFSYPIWGSLSKKYGMIPIDRSKIQSAMGSLDELEKEIHNGVSAFVAPEGTRTLDGKLNEFKKGAFHVAKNTGITIVPIILEGSFKAKRKNDWRIQPGVVTATLAEKITKEVYANMNVNELKDHVRNIFKSTLEK